MQIKLVLNDTFAEYYFGDNESYKEESKDKNIKIEKYNWPNDIIKVLNVVISDTYYIDTNKLPNLYLSTPTIHIIRQNNNNNNSDNNNNCYYFY